MLANNMYLHRHNTVCTYIHWTILRDLGVKDLPDSWLLHKPTSTMSVGKTTIMYDTAILTDKRVRHNVPDLVVWDQAKQSARIIDVAIPMDRNVVAKYAEKLVNYRDLEIEIKKCWKLKSVRTSPIIVGALGSICEGLQENLQFISTRLDYQVVQKTALLGTARVLRNFLTSQGQHHFTK